MSGPDPHITLRHDLYILVIYPVDCLNTEQHIQLRVTDGIADAAGIS